MSHLKILSSRRVATGKFHTTDPQILGATEINLVVKATWRLGCEQSAAILLLQRGVVGSPTGTSAVLTDTSRGFPQTFGQAKAQNLG
jgi:hypothetical protein